MIDNKFSPEQRSFIEKNKLDSKIMAETTTQILIRLGLTKKPSEKPIAFIVGGQPGSGKSGIISNIMQNYGQNYILIDNDEYRMYHPNLDEINRLFPELYTECTDQLSFETTPKAIKYAMDNRYNMIIHQTLKNDTIINCAITDLTNSGYTIIVVVMAADELTSNEGMLRRCQDKLEFDGTCRWVSQENHDFAYKGLPTTVGHIEERGLYDAIVVVTRSVDPEHPENVNVIHKVVNPDMPEHHMDALESINFSDENIKMLDSAKEAVIVGRKADGEYTLNGLEDRIAQAKKRASTPEEFKRIKHLEELYAQEKAKKNLDKGEDPEKS